MNGPGDQCPLTPDPDPPIPLISGEPAPQPDSRLLALPPELLHRVLLESAVGSPAVLAKVATVCRALRVFVFENPDTALWRDLILTRYDDPRAAGAYPDERENIDWKALYKERTFIERTLENAEDIDVLCRIVDRVNDTLVDLYLDIPAKAATQSETEDMADAQLSSTTPATTRNGPILEHLLSTPAFEKLYTAFSAHEPEYRQNPDQPYYLRQRRRRPISIPALARLHSLLPPRNIHDMEHMDPSTEEYTAAARAHRAHRGYVRELVYSGSHYREDNDWAPLRPDGTVDWTLVDAIGGVMMLNAMDVLSMGVDIWKVARPPMSQGIESVRGLGLLGLKRPANLGEDEPWDWAGIGGWWNGSYAFMEYRHWVQLNEPHLLQLRRGERPLDLTTYLEAIGDLMELEVIVDRDPSGADDAYSDLIGVERGQYSLPSTDTQLPVSQLLPPIYFHGRSRQVSADPHHAAGEPRSFVRGVVRLTADDPPEIRWTLVISYGGADRWRMEGVQVGGPGSRRGFFGVWTDSDREEHSPNGPVWYWKQPHSLSPSMIRDNDARPPSHWGES